MKELPENYIPHRAEDFDITIKNGEPKFKDRSGMTELARRSGGPVMAILKAILVFCLTGFVAMFTLPFIPDGWSDSAHAEAYWAAIVVMLGAPTVTLVLHLRRKWLRWSLLGFVGALVLVGGFLLLAEHLVIHLL